MLWAGEQTQKKAEKYRKKEREKKHKKGSEGGSCTETYHSSEKEGEKPISNSLRKNQVRRELLHLNLHLKIANSLLAKKFGIICYQSQNMKWYSLRRINLKSQNVLTVQFPWRLGLIFPTLIKSARNMRCFSNKN